MLCYRNYTFKGEVFIYSKFLFAPEVAKMVCFFVLPTKLYILKKILFIYFEREGKGERKRGRERSMCERNITFAPTRDQAHKPDIYHDLELNW